MVGEEHASQPCMDGWVDSALGVGAVNSVWWCPCAERLLVSVHHRDESSAELWKKVAQLPDERILRLGDEVFVWRPCRLQCHMAPFLLSFVVESEHLNGWFWGGGVDSPA